MCGRFSFVVEKEKIKKKFPKLVMPELLNENYNVAPTQQAYVITNREHPKLHSMQWGLIPHWAKDAQGSLALINARMETLSEKPSFKEAIKHQRCLVLMDSFYEWKTEGGRKVPYRILMKNDELMVLAGLWDEWRGLRTFSIITTEPNKEMSTIHNRMPVVLQTEDDFEMWLGKTDLTKILKRCKKQNNGILSMYRVSEKLNSVKNNGSDLHKEVPKDLTLF
jgi:putative SOS response-associated peptidase YedK